MPEDTQLKKIADLLQLDALPEDEREEMYAEIGDLVAHGSLIRLMEGMSAETRAEFDALVERRAPEEELEAFLEEKAPYADEAIQATIDTLASDILAATSR